MKSTATNKQTGTPFQALLPQIVTGTYGDDFMMITGDQPSIVTALHGDDTISFAGNGDHTAYGGNGDDTINMNGPGKVTAYGGDDDDTFNVNSKADHYLDGGDGHDIGDFRGLTGFSFSDKGLNIDLAQGEVTSQIPWTLNPFKVTFENIEEIYGSYWDDHFTGSQEADIVHGVAGFDTFHGNGGDDIFYAGVDGSRAYGWQDDDTLKGNRGKDTFFGGNGDDSLSGEAGEDFLNGDAGDDIIYGGDGDDVIIAGTGHDEVYAGDGWNIVHATGSQYDHDRGNDKYFGGIDRDVLTYENSDVAIYLNAQLNVAGARVPGEYIGLDEFHGFETFIGSSHDDFLRSSNLGYGPYRENIQGGDGDDTVYASKGSDIYHGDEGFDTVDFSGMYSAVTIHFDNAGPYLHDAKINDDLYHLEDFESFIGTGLDDTFVGDAGDNMWEGWRGHDTATGLDGDDTFVFRASGGHFGYDRITDFVHGEDKILVEDLNLWDATAINSAADLDTNGNGVLDNGDEPIWINSEGVVLLFAQGSVLLEGATEINADDFIFA